MSVIMLLWRRNLARQLDICVGASEKGGIEGKLTFQVVSCL